MYQTLQENVVREMAVLTLNRPEAANSLNNTMIREMIHFLDKAAERADIRMIVIKGNATDFCTGLDFKAMADGAGEALLGEDDPDAYYDLLEKISLHPKVVVALVEGKANAGGIGIVAASDLVIAGERAVFGLSEALFGLLPACVLPFLIRRTGFQKAKWMTLMTQPISAGKAQQIGLVDEVSAQPEDTLRLHMLRLVKLESDTVKDMKQYLSDLWIIQEETRQLAVGKIKGLLHSERVRTNIKNFVQYNKFPWEK